MLDKNQLPATWEQMTQQEQHDYILYDQLCNACRGQNWQINIAEIDRLLDAGAKAHNSVWEQQHHSSCVNALLSAAMRKQIDFPQFTRVFNRFCAAGLDCLKLQSTEHNPLYTAIDYGLPKIVAWLIEEKKMDVNRRGIDKSTPLHSAVESKHGNEEELIECLLKHNASVYNKNRFGKTPYEEALALGKTKLLPLLSLKIKPEISQENAWQIARSNHSSWLWNHLTCFWKKKSSKTMQLNAQACANHNYHQPKTK